MKTLRNSSVARMAMVTGLLVGIAGCPVNQRPPQSEKPDAAKASPAHEAHSAPPPQDQGEASPMALPAPSEPQVARAENTAPYPAFETGTAESASSDPSAADPTAPNESLQPSPAMPDAAADDGPPLAEPPFASQSPEAAMEGPLPAIESPEPVESEAAPLEPDPRLAPDPAAGPSSRPLPELGAAPESDGGPLYPNPLREGTTPEAETAAIEPAAETPPVEEQLASSAPGPEGAAQLALRSGKGARKGSADFDPIAENGAIFEGWPKPDLAFLISGRMNGYFEPCGCAGLEKMKGGLSRRHSLAEQLRGQGWPLVLVDAGGLSKGSGEQTKIKFHSIVDALRKIGYHGITLGGSDLRLPAGDLVSDAAGEESPFLSACVGLFGFDLGVPAPFKIVEAGGFRIGIVGILGKKEQGQIQSEELELLAPEEALAKILPQLKDRTDLLVLLAHADKDETIELVKKFPVFTLAVTTGGGYDPPKTEEIVAGTTTRLIETGEKGMNAVVVGLYRPPQTPSFRYQRVPLDSRFPGTKAMHDVMVAYQFQLEERGWAGLGLKPVAAPRSDLLGKYVGSKACADCHEYSYKAWRMTSHARAYATLAELDPPRVHDPECISCHVVGWHPTEYFPYASGFDSLKATPHLLDVGCETCHGPGEAHIKAEAGADLELQERLYEAMRVTKDQADQAVCRSCHDLDNSPAFQFETYWPDVEHYEDKDWFDAWRAKQQAKSAGEGE